jgi:hypothetical protein
MTVALQVLLALEEIVREWLFQESMAQVLAL